MKGRAQGLILATKVYSTSLHDGTVTTCDRMLYEKLFGGQRSLEMGEKWRVLAMGE